MLDKIIERFGPSDGTREEAMDAIQRCSPHARIVVARFGMGYFSNEMLTDEHRNEPLVLGTLQNWGHLDEQTEVRTEFRIPINKEPEGDEQAGLAIRLRMAFILRYAFSPEVAKDLQGREATAKVTGVMHAWPYWREFFSSSMGRMQIFAPPPPLIGIDQAAQMSGYRTKAEIEAVESTKAEAPKP